jgi:hypothetical protein
VKFILAASQNYLITIIVARSALLAEQREREKHKNFARSF